MSYVNKETLRQMWRKSKAYTDEKLTAVPDNIGYWDGEKLVLDNLEEGDYYVRFLTPSGLSDEKTAIAHNPDDNAILVELPADCTHIAVYNGINERLGIIRTSGVSARQVQPDMAETNPSSMAYIKNKTHGIGRQLETILPYMAPQYVANTGNFMINDRFSLTAGADYVVNYNGTDYYCTAVEFSEGEMSAVVLGNIGMIVGGENTGEPFIIVMVPEEMTEQMGGTAQCMPLDGAQSFRISISGYKETLIPLDEKYMPQSMAQLVLRSATAGSNKKFAITVDDSGTITATEIA